jgi:ribonuclease HII
MVVACVAAPRERLFWLKEIGVKDSKLLTPGRRRELFDALIGDGLDFSVQFATPAEIDAVNLNRLHFDRVVRLIAQTHADVYFVDAPVPPAGLRKYRKELQGITGRKVYPLNKADERIPVVAAASIVAKVVRDRSIEYLRAAYGEFGSGYPSDPVTRAWLKENLQFAKQKKVLREKWRLKTL